MHDLFFFWTLLILTFVAAGIVKGVTGMGLPTVAMGLMGTVMPPVAAAAILFIPSLITNVWQWGAGPGGLQQLRRFWPMLLAVLVVTIASMGWLVQANSVWSSCALGLALLAYAGYALLAPNLRVPVRWEPVLSPLVGLLTGAITGATGVFVMPIVPYLQALDLDKDALVQVLGMAFTVSTLALGAGLYWQGAFRLEHAGISLLVVLPALLGMWLGQRIRARISVKRFKQLFLLFLTVLGLQLTLRPWL